jgi:hypothetical protein
MGRGHWGNNPAQPLRMAVEDAYDALTTKTRRESGERQPAYGS